LKKLFAFSLLAAALIMFACGEKNESTAPKAEADIEVETVPAAEEVVVEEVIEEEEVIEAAVTAVEETAEDVIEDAE
jgi:ABC-type glycerol-3-phosphate transport system substrate-binding protein